MNQPSRLRRINGPLASVCGRGPSRLRLGARPINCVPRAQITAIVIGTLATMAHKRTGALR